MTDEFDDFDDRDCWNCSGEGFVYDCFTEYACVDPEGGCDMCGRRCDVCNPAKRNPDLDAVLAEALASAVCPVCSGDCGSANPPVMFCPMKNASPA